MNQQAKSGLWGALVLKGDKAEIRARRRQAVEEKTQREAEVGGDTGHLVHLQFETECSACFYLYALCHVHHHCSS